MRTILNRFFVTLGILFFCILCGLTYLVVADPYHVRPLVQLVWKARTSTTVVPPITTFKATSTAPATLEIADTTATTTSAPNAIPTPIALPSAQAEALQAVGIDPTIISQITPEQQACFIQLFGQARVMSIIAGAVPTADEFLKASACL